MELCHPLRPGRRVIGRREFLRRQRRTVVVEEGNPAGGAYGLPETVGVPRVPQPPIGPPVLGAGAEDAGRLFAGHGTEAQHEPLRPVEHRGRTQMQIRREGQPVRVAGQDHGAVGGDRRAASEQPGQVPVHQVGYQMAQVRGESSGHLRTVRGGHLREVERGVDAGRREGAAPVTGQSPLRRPLDHPARHGVPAGPEQARRLLRL